MNSSYTPGPWKLQDGRCIVTSSGTFYLAYGTEKGSNAPLFRNFCELDRNAQLVAAAPDLLAALEDCRQALSNALATATYKDATSRIASAYAESKAASIIEQATRSNV